MRHRDLFVSITEREIKVKYKQSLMGLLWAVFMPLLIVVAGILVKLALTRITGATLNNRDIVALAARAVPWAFFVTSIRFGSLSLISNSNLVTKIYMPREIFPFAAVASQLVDFVVASLGLLVLIPLLGIRPTTTVLLVPLFVLNLIVLAAACALVLAAASLFFRDVKYLVEVFVTFAIFFTPVFFDVRMFGSLSSLLLLNPVAPLLEGISAAVLGEALPSAAWFAYSSVFSLLSFCLALVLFKRSEPYFAEVA